MEVGDKIKVRIRRYRELEDKGIGLTNEGKLVIVSEMFNDDEEITAEITRILAQTILAKRVENDLLEENVVSTPSKTTPKTTGNVYDIDGDDDDDFED